MAFHVFDNSMTHTIPILYICYLLLLKSKINKKQNSNQMMN